MSSHPLNLNTAARHKCQEPVLYDALRLSACQLGLQPPSSKFRIALPAPFLPPLAFCDAFLRMRRLGGLGR